MPDSPLISCIMPTANRRQFVPQALALFLAQDYPHTELIVIDDGEDDIADLLPADVRIRYQRLPGRLTIGAKRNLACQLAQGEFIAHWDDDDWYAPQRLSTQLAELRRSGCAVCGLDRVLFDEPHSGRAWEYRYPAAEKPWAYGATLLYRRDFWQTQPFAELNIGEDNRFVWAVPPGQLLRHADNRWYVGRVHAGNTSRKNTGDRRWFALDPAQLPAQQALPADAPWHGPSVCIGVVCGDDGERLLATLARLRQTTPPQVGIVLLPDRPEPALQAQLAQLTAYRQLPGAEPGGAACFNRLAVASDSAVLVLLEAGALPGQGWLQHLLAPLLADAAIGIAGPSTNRAWNMQQLFPDCGADPAAIDACAATAAQRFAGQWRDAAPLYCIGDFCYAVTRAVIESIGAADEGFGAGPCWEMEYSARAARAGFGVAWAQAAFVFRPPFGARRAADEAQWFEASKRRYQDNLCGRRLRGACSGYDAHCTGEACADFAPEALIRLQRPLAPLQAERLPLVVASPPLPLVSCIMPTRGRPDYVLQAWRYFQRQDYPHKQLIVVGDSRADVPETLLQQPQVVFIAAGNGRSIGHKRNLACQQAQGDIIVQWDDDDWYSPQRLSRQLEPLLRREAEVSALGHELHFELQAWRFWRCSAQLHRRMYVRDVFGGTLAFRRRFWLDGVSYPDRSLAEDAALLNLLLARGARLQALQGQGLMCYLRHPDNSWRFACGEFIDRSGWQQMAEPEWFAEDRDFYLRLTAPAIAERLRASA